MKKLKIKHEAVPLPKTVAELKTIDEPLYEEYLRRKSKYGGTFKEFRNYLKGVIIVRKK